MWTIENRARYDRSKLRYPSDVTDEEWSHVEPLIRPGKRGGNKRTVNVREVVNGLMPGFKWSSQHLERGGCDDCSEAAFGSVRARRVAPARSALCCAA